MSLPVGSDGRIECPHCQARNGVNAMVCTVCCNLIHGKSDPRYEGWARKRARQKGRDRCEGKTTVEAILYYGDDTNAWMNTLRDIKTLKELV